MPLFAEVSEMEKWIGPVLASAASLAATIMAYLTSRDKLRFDSERVKMQSDIAYLTDQHKVCHEESLSQASEIRELRRQMYARGYKSDPPIIPGITGPSEPPKP